ncbi:AAA family ATPase [Runella zeae]|uniref:AAA family ATPase n=1 Tax=Runella zeae TaxID=94255 RepID=UPI0003F9F7ED|nr:ATP-binding protein [Runella zeae]
MKVSHIYIKDNHQFKDFELDLTYPAGHPKAGKPLDKVCIIGQSGTGKTSLLNKLAKPAEKIYYSEPTTKSDQINNNQITTPLDFNNKNSSFIKYVNSDSDIRFTLFDNGYLVYKNGIESSQSRYSLPIMIDAHTGEKDLGENLQYWKDIIKDIIVFREQEIQKKLEIAELVTTNQELLQAELDKFNEWQKSRPNPLKDLADNYLDKLLSQFHLRVRQSLDFKKTEDIKTIKIETIEGKEVPNNLLSTGTKQIILTTLPLYASKPTKTIILFDEPERSLYPDIQTKIIDFYTSLSTDCQFFFATHSPLIASCFEPWEIIELKFKPDGSVYRELYYDSQKENHVDNYTIDPRYLRWDSILTRIFDLDNDSNEARTRKLMELATLRSKLHKANGKLSVEEKQKLQAQFEKLANLLDWEYDAEN